MGGAWTRPDGLRQRQRSSSGRPERPPSCACYGWSPCPHFRGGDRSCPRSQSAIFASEPSDRRPFRNRLGLRCFARLFSGRECVLQFPARRAGLCVGIAGIAQKPRFSPRNCRQSASLFLCPGAKTKQATRVMLPPGRFGAGPVLAGRIATGRNIVGDAGTGRSRTAGLRHLLRQVLRLGATSLQDFRDAVCAGVARLRLSGLSASLSTSRADSTH